MKTDVISEETESTPAAANRPCGEEVMNGIPASPGIAIGIVLLAGGGMSDPSSLLRETPVRSVAENDVPLEVERFKAAVEQTRNEIVALRKRVQDSLEEKEASIFDAHLLIVDDRMLMDEVASEIRKKRCSAESVFSQTIQRYISAISAVQDPYLRERASDVADVAGRILGHLFGRKRTILDRLPGQRIIVSHDLTPSDTAMLDRENVQAFVTETGSRTSHSAILARSMKIPAVVGVPGIAAALRNGDMLIVDGFQGLAIRNPSPETLDSYAQQEALKEKLFNDLMNESNFRPETVDGYRVELAANIDDAAAAGDAKTYGAGGIGLFRTEYLFMNTDHIPTEEEQFQVYRSLAEKADGKPVVIRTLDLGGDKLSSLINFTHEANPFLGLRSVRLCLAYPQLLIPQLRAILRAGVSGNVRMMFPMITCEDELDDLRKLLDGVKENLRAEKVRFCESMETGIMIETPAAAMFPERFAEKCDFFSIGTNDLVQYTMAVDRGNERVAKLYRPLHPVILKLIRNVVKAANRTGIWVSVCGEMASDPRYIPLLVGLGVQELSMSPVALGPARRVIRKLNFLEAEALARYALECTSQAEVLTAAENLLRRVAPDVSRLNSNQ